MPAWAAGVALNENAKECLQWRGSRVELINRAKMEILAMRGFDGQ